MLGVSARLAAALLGLLILAGCVESPPGSDAARSLAPAAQAEDAETGSLRVTVTNPDYEPLEGAQVILAPLDHAQLTDQQGQVTFLDLEPGEYTVIGAKPGHRPQEARGRIVTVEAGRTAEARLTLIRLEVANASASYHLTYIFRGFVACSFSVGGTSASSCRGVAFNENVVRDPNENSTHAVPINGPRAYSAVLESRWTPTVSGLAAQMHLSLNKVYRCTPGCTVDGQIMEARGASPLYASTKSDYMVARHLPEGTTFPASLYAAMRTSCLAPCTASIAFQQPYDMVATVFYDAPAPAEFRALPQS